MRRLTSLLALAIVGMSLFVLRPVEAQTKTGPMPSEYAAGQGGFIENLGQWDDAVRYHLGSRGTDVWLTDEGWTLSVLDLSPLVPDQSTNPGPVLTDQPQGPSGDETVDGHAVTVRFAGGIGVNDLDAATLEPLSPRPGTHNWLVGDIDVTGARMFGEIVYRDAFPGIDAHLIPIDTRGDATSALAGESNEVKPGVMKTTWTVDPGADPTDIALEYIGAESMSLVGGNLVIETSIGDFTELRPYAFQQGAGGGTETVPVGFILDGNVVRFQLGAYDAGRTLYIDPIVIFSRLLIGGTNTDYIAEAHSDASGHYFTGFTFSSDYPTTSGAFQTVYLGGDLFASKVSTDYQTLIYSTYVGSSSTDYGGNSALKSDGTLYIGSSTLSASTWPKLYTYGFVSGYDHGIMQLSANGQSMITGASLGSSSTDYFGDIELDASGNVVIVGMTFTSNFPLVAGFDTSYLGSDGMVYRMSSNLASMLDFSYIPGSSTVDAPSDVRFDGSGNVYVYGVTLGGLAFGSTDTFGPRGNYDAFVTKFNSGLDAMSYNVVIGGTSTDVHVGYSYTSNFYYNTAESGLLVDGSGQAWITGTAASTDWPTTPGSFQPANGGNYDVYVTALNSAGTALLYSTYIGGTSTDIGRALGMDADGNIYMAGTAASTNYPTTTGEVQPASGGGYDFVRTVFLPDLSDTLCSTYYGGNSTDIAQDLEMTATQYRALVSGLTLSTNFPSVGGGQTFGGGASYSTGIVDLNCGGAALAVANEEVIADPLDAGRDCLTAGDFLIYSFDIENTGLGDQPDNPGPEFSGIFTGPQTILSCTADSGTCSVTGATSVEWNGTIPAGGLVHFEIRGRVNGGVPAGTELCLLGTVMFDPGTGDNEVVEEFEVCRATDCPPTVDPNAQLGGQVHLPILNFQGQNDVCRTWIEVQNVGDEFSKAALVTWGEPGFCPPQCAGPLKVECSGLLKPGSTWNFLGAQVPSGSKSGILFSFTARQLSEIGVDLGFDDIVADVLCETLFFGVVGDCDDYRRFKKAYNEGLEFAGIPLDRAVGGYLAVEVLRHCPGDVTPGVEVSSKYGGIAGLHLGAYDPVFGGYAYYVPLVYAQANDFNSIIYIQNGGLECSSVEIWFKEQDDCLRARICEIFTLAPGETYQFDPNDCVGPDFQGSAWLRSSQPMGIAVDLIGKDVLMTYIGEPTELNYTFDPEQAFFTMGNQVAYGPLIYSEYQGWDSGIQVQNMSSVVAAKVKVYFLDRSGGIITTLVDWICPRGSQTFFLPVIADLPGNWVGSVRVESQEWWSPGDPLVLPPNIVGVATLIKYTDAARSDTAEAIAYNLLPEHKAYDWQIGFGGGGLDSGIGLIAIPSLVKDLDGTGITTEIAITNLVPKPGFTDFAIYIYDQNGLIDYICQKLNEKQVEYIDLETWGYLNPGFKGSAIISAVFWEHDVFDETGFFMRNLVGLAAVMVERTGTRLGEDVPGDEAAGTAGIPFRESAEDDNEFFFDFEGPVAPLCPGVGSRPGEGEGCNADQFDQSYQFNMNTQQSIALTHVPPDTGCDTGPGWVNRAWDTVPLVINLECPATLTATLDATTIPPAGAPFSIVNVLLYESPGRDPADFCLNLLDTTSKNINNQFQGQFQMAGDVYTFVERSTGDVLVLEPGTYYLMAHVSASFNNGTADVSFDFEAP